MSNYKYDWGEAVRVIDGSPAKYLPLSEGSICGIREVETEATSLDFSVPIGSVLYLVESSRGVAIEIPEIYLTAF